MGFVMRHNENLLFRRTAARFALGLTAASLLSGFAHAASCVALFSDVFDFNGQNGQAPGSTALVVDSKGNLYGATPSGGAYLGGVVFKLTPPTGSATTWTETVLWSFNPGGRGGSYPNNGLLIGANGVLYGMTSNGGAYGNGAVFQLTPPAAANGSWTETVLYNFGVGSKDSSSPNGNTLVQGPNGVLYGAAQAGGSHGDGTVFQLTPPGANCTPIAGNAWCEKILHSFGNGASDGVTPSGALALDPSGNLYGTTSAGGSNIADTGTVFKLSPPTEAGGAWKESILRNFQISDGAFPAGGVVIDSYGNLYGTTNFFGGNGSGTVFELSPPASSGGAWSETTLYNFPLGASSTTAVTIGPKGVLYGTTQGAGFVAGTVFSLAPPANLGGAWTPTLLSTFETSGPNIASISAAALVESSGKVFGTSSFGGANGNGFVWEFQIP